MASETGADTSKAAEVTLTNVPVKCRFATYWFNSKYGNVGITALPGRSKSGSHTKTLVKQDFELLFQQTVSDIFLFCTPAEVSASLPNVDFTAVAKSFSMTVHHHPIQVGLHPTVQDANIIHNDIEKCLKENKALILVSRNGFGRAATIMATYLMKQKPNLKPDAAMEEVRDYRGHPAIQTVKQYNFLHDYYAYLKEMRQDNGANAVEDSSGHTKITGKRTLNTP